MIVHNVNQWYCSDIAFFEKFKRFNDNYAYLLITRDHFSKLISVVPLRTKTGKEVSTALKLAFKELKGVPERGILTDQGGEYIAKETQQMFKQLKVRHVTSSTMNKAYLCEVGIRYLKLRIYRYLTANNTKRFIDVLPLIVKQMNHKVHSVLNVRPVDISSKNADEIFSRMYRKLITTPRPPPKFQVGSKVRISSKRLVFSKSYLPGYSETVFRVKAIIPTYPVYSFKLETLEGEELDSSFVSDEMSYVSD